MAFLIIVNQRPVPVPPPSDKSRDIAGPREGYQVPVDLGRGALIRVSSHSTARACVMTYRYMTVAGIGRSRRPRVTNALRSRRAVENCIRLTRQALVGLHSDARCAGDVAGVAVGGIGGGVVSVVAYCSVGSGAIDVSVVVDRDHAVVFGGSLAG